MKMVVNNNIEGLIPLKIKRINNKEELQYHVTGMISLKKYGIERKVHCLGYQNNPYPYIKYADCFVLSSRWEGLPNVLIEALHLGTPAAAFRCIPIIERIINDGATGFTAEKENVDSLAQAMSKSVDLGRIQSSYKSSKIEDFTKLFNYE